jgi:predicted transcriptional regulator
LLYNYSDSSPEAIIEWADLTIDTDVKTNHQATNGEASLNHETKKQLFGNEVIIEHRAVIMLLSQEPYGIERHSSNSTTSFNTKYKERHT